MLEMLSLTDQVLKEMGVELGGCDFTREHQKQFLSRMSSCIVQAAPGHGKTTLILAKVALLARRQQPRTQGICIISHTNAARREVEEKLSRHPTASAYLNYPHFVGTVSAFINQFIALPYLRGLGWRIKSIDDDIFTSVVLARYRTKDTLGKTARNGRRRLEGFLASMQLAHDFDAAPGATASSLKIADRSGQAGPQTATRREMEELKAELVQDGYFRFGDMNAIAQQALRKSPTLGDRLRQRFPFVLLDEAQDTTDIQLDILESIFGLAATFQKMGDVNQTLYEQEGHDESRRWCKSDQAIPLSSTRRFGADIAAFASRLTARHPQTIEGREGQQSRRVLILFDRKTIGGVLPAYVEQLCSRWGEATRSEISAWVVGSRHNPHRERGGNWPRSLSDYWAGYRGNGRRSDAANSFCGAMRQANVLMASAGSMTEAVSLLSSAVVELCPHHGIRSLQGRYPTAANVWSVLSRHHPELLLTIRRLFRDEVLLGNAPWDQDAWTAFCRNIHAALGGGEVAIANAKSYCAFLDEPQQAELPLNDKFDTAGFTITPGSIHSIKGRTVDAVLVVESEVNRKLLDLGTVLPHALGIETVDFTSDRTKLAAATNTFVAVTRAKHLLALAMRAEAASPQLRDAAVAQGWIIIEAVTPEVKASAQSMEHELPA